MNACQLVGPPLDRRVAALRIEFFSITVRLGLGSKVSGQVTATAFERFDPLVPGIAQQIGFTRYELGE